MAWKDKSVVITGGAKGFGRYLALGSAERGAKVAVCDVDDVELRALTGELRPLCENVLALRVDVREESEVRRFMRDVEEAFGAIDYLVNNAAIVPHFNWGLPRWPRVRDMEFSFWSNVIATNLHGTFLCSKYAIPYMERQHSGHIVNVFGGGALSPPGAVAYVLTKEAGVVFTRFLAEEVREHNICVMSMGPASDHPLATEKAPEEARRRMLGPEASGERFFLAAEAPMGLSGHLVDFVDGSLVAVR